MSSIIFKKETVKKSEWFTWFINKWTEAGWTDISSNPSADGAVMYSEGEKGDKTLYLGFSGDIYTNPTGVSNQTMTIRQCRTYVPNPVQGVAGKFGTTRYSNFRLFGYGDAYHVDQLFDIWYYMNKNWGIIVFEEDIVKVRPARVLIVGKPDIELGPTDKTAMIIACSYMDMTQDTGSNSYNIISYTGDPFSNPNSGRNLKIYTGYSTYLIGSAQRNTPKQNTHFCSDIAIGDDTIGYKFLLDDSILITQSDYISHTMNYNIDGQTYRFFYLNDGRVGNYYNSFYNQCVGIRIK